MPRQSITYLEPDIDSYGLDPYEFRVYVHIDIKSAEGRGGQYFAYQSDMAKCCGMSVRKLQYCVEVLSAVGLIYADQQKGKGGVYSINPKSKWADPGDLPAIQSKFNPNKTK